MKILLKKLEIILTLAILVMIAVLAHRLHEKQGAAADPAPAIDPATLQMAADALAPDYGQVTMQNAASHENAH
jgi:hypothetical protein